MSDLKPCPFCGEAPHVTARPDNATQTEFFAAVACYCGGYSACAHKMAFAPTRAEAEALAFAAWNERKTPNVAGNRLARQGQSELTGVLGGRLRTEKD